MFKAASELQVLGEESKFGCLQIPSFNSLFLKGLPRGGILEINGSQSSGRTSLSLHILAQATGCGEVCAVIDFDDNFHPASAAASGVRLENVIWVRCRRNAEHALRAADLLLHAGGFGVVMLDLCAANARVLNRLPLSYWYRFRQTVEHTPTILLLCAELTQAKPCALFGLDLRPKVFNWTGEAPFLLLRELKTDATLRKILTAQPQTLFIQTAA